MKMRFIVPAMLVAAMPIGMGAALDAAWARAAPGINPGTVVGNVYESAHLTGFGLAQPSPCGTFAFDPCPPAKPHKHPRPH